MLRKEFVSYFQGSLSQTVGGKSLNSFTAVTILNYPTGLMRNVGPQGVGRKIGLPQFMAGLGLFSNDICPETSKVTLKSALYSVLDNS